MEIWKDIKNYEWLYQISNLWRLKSLGNSRTRKEKIKKTRLNHWWYEYVFLNKAWVRKQLRIHRLISEYFLPNPYNKPYINHKNWIRNDNRLENLEWCTNSENILHSVNILKNKHWRYWSNYKTKKINQFTLDWDLIKSWMSMRDINKCLGINTWNISNVCNWIRKSTGGYVFKYV